MERISTKCHFALQLPAKFCSDIPPHHNRHLLQDTHTWTHKSLYCVWKDRLDAQPYTQKTYIIPGTKFSDNVIWIVLEFKTLEALETSELNGVLLLWRWLPGISFTLCFFPFVSPPSCLRGAWIIGAHSMEAPEVLTLTLLTVCSLAPAPWWSSSQPLPDCSVTLAWLDTHVQNQLGRSPFTTVLQAHQPASAGAHNLLSFVLYFFDPVSQVNLCCESCVSSIFLMLLLSFLSMHGQVQIDEALQVP